MTVTVDDLLQQANRVVMSRERLAQSLAAWERCEAERLAVMCAKGLDERAAADLLAVLSLARIYVLEK